MNAHQQEEAVIGILESETFAHLWSRHYRTRRHENAARSYAAEIREHTAKETPIDPRLLKFMIELVRLEALAVANSTEKQEPDAPALLKNLQQLRLDLEARTQGRPLPTREGLTNEQKKILDMVERQTATKPFRPVSSLLNAVRRTALHIAHDAKDHPIAFSGLLAASLGTLAFMRARLGNSATIYIDPAATTMTNFSLDSMDNPAATLETDQAFLNMDFQPSCHDHLSQLMGQNTADFVKQTLDMAGMFPAHCSKLKTLAEEAQNNLERSYNFVNSRLEMLIRDPATDIAQRLIPDSPFLSAFNQSAHSTAEFIYALNTVENVVVHTLIFASSVLAAAKLGTMESEEIRALRQDIGDFAYRQVRLNPAALALGTAGSATALIMHGGINPDTLWAGLAGVLVGRIIHNGIRRAHALEFVKASAPSSLSVSRQEAQDADPILITGDNKAGDPNSGASSRRTWWNNVTKPAAGVGTLVILTTIDSLATGGQVAGNIMGALGVTIPFLAYNLPEDAALHIIFGIAGGIAGAAWAGTSNAINALKRAILNIGTPQQNQIDIGNNDEPSQR
ncbi:MAG: hypothetical protein IPH06_04110 [Alphaproteobacteria bacterium]|nr:hypothetical protein [Alphaproteobacteria bacterium]QQS57216.1 MAG: hypothetical protein IPN28_13425 [Alphaproteobacteria bacterium]